MLPDRPARTPDREALTRAIADLLLASGAELDAETRGTPERVAKAWVEDLLDGYGKDPVAALKSSLVPAPKKGELVIVSQIDFHSMCPHHLLPYKGSAAVGYAADRQLVGFGKIAEAVDALAHRLILQENLVQRLCASVMEALQPLGAGVVITAEHACMQVRGPRRRQSRVSVEAWAGSFEKDPELRASLARRAEG
ncbi:MAG TPA: GTP cyclohydrolase I [Myxococcales bacterium]|jgi:GTP cyclohydrolase I|nr:GTP cyclohydrolase I [Myxococcales bacterium]